MSTELEKYNGMKTRHICPNCGKQHVFARYIDTETNTYISDNVGRCNREINCGYRYSPLQYFQDNNISSDTPHRKACTPRHVTPRPASLIDTDIFKASLNQKALDNNNFVKFLIDLFGTEIASELVSRYFIGTSKYWDGATVFWQVDTTGKIRTGKIMLYNSTTGKRVKEPLNYITWVHKALKTPEWTLKQCLFAEHLLAAHQHKPIAVVESEKTAVIASAYLPQFIWLACGSLTNLNAERCSILKGRNVTLYPDLNGFDKWSSKAKEFGYKISDFLERNATEAERKQGLDIADYLIKFPLPPVYPPSWDTWQTNPVSEINQYYLDLNNKLNQHHETQRN